MRLRRVGPGVGGLYYPNLLKRDGALEPRTVPAAAPASRLPAAWARLAAAARRAGRAVIDARIAQAKRMIEMEAGRLAGRDGGATGRDALGSRYY